MPPTPTKSKDDEPKLTLPAGHPQAGYLSPDLSFQDGFNGAVDDETADAREEMIAAREEEAQAIAENEHKAASEEQKALEEKAKKDRERQEQVAAGKISQQQANEMKAAQDSLDASAETGAASSGSKSSG
jgi:ParB-like chromosome segregation protein Spo0J